VKDFTIDSDYDLTIKGGTVVTASGAFQGDLGVRGRRIAAWGIDLRGRQELDAGEMLVLPGAVDPHVHLNMPAGPTRSSDDWASGTLAAACGGTTTLVDFVEPEPGQTLTDALGARQAEATGRTHIDYGLHMTLASADPATLAAVPHIMAAGCPTFKAYTTYEGFALQDSEMLAAMQAVAAAGGMLMVHCENDAMIKSAEAQLIAENRLDPSAHPVSRPARAEADAIQHVIHLAATAACPVYIVHISTLEGALALRKARHAGLAVKGETCPQYLLLDDSLYAKPGFEAAKFVCSPPLRTSQDNMALWTRLADGTIDVAATDHCPFNFAGQKELGKQDFRRIPNGLPGVELRLSLMYTFGVRAGQINMEDWVRICCTAPAMAFGLYPRKGSLAPGADADIIIFDPERKVKISQPALHEQVDYTPYEGLALNGTPRTVLQRGKILFDDGKFLGAPGAGNFLPGSFPTGSRPGP
jgi:dihydropyrimidinase